MNATTSEGAVALMARYNLWANEVYAQCFGTADPELLDKHVTSSFPSIHKTLLHIWDAQDVWYRRLHGENPRTFRSSNWSGTPAEVLEGLLQSSRDYVTLVEGFDAAALAEVLDYITISWGPQSSKRYAILLHVFNHSMYHRGQCVTMARQLGLTVPTSTDLIYYLQDHES